MIKSKLKHEAVLAKQDLLFYNILDFVSKNKANGTRRALGGDFPFFMQKYGGASNKKNNQVGIIAKDILKGTNDEFSNLKVVLKAAKAKLRNNENLCDEERSLVKRIIKSLKVYQYYRL